MNIVLGSHYFHPHIGGIESVVESHAKRLADRGHDVTVITTDVGAESLGSQRNGYNISRYPAWNPVEQFGAPYPIPSPVSAKSRIRNVIEQEERDVIHAHGMNYLTTSLLLKNAPLHTPVILHQHTPFVEYPFPANIVEMINDRTVGKWNLSQADKVYYVSRNIGTYIESISTEVNSELMTNGVDTDKFRPNRTESGDGIGMDSVDPVFFALSRLSQKKGIDVLLDAARKLDQQSTELQIVVAGDGPMRNNVKAATRNIDILKYRGRISDEKLPRYYSAADGFIFTSKSGEAFPTLTMMEAYASGTPVISSKLTDDPVGIKDGENSVLVKPDDSDELAQAIAKLAEDRDQLQSMSKQARETAVRYFSLEDRIDRLEKCYSSM